MTDARTGTFIATKEHRRFTEFAEAVRKHRYIGLGYGAAGVGKTLSARRYAHWDLAGPLIETWPARDPSNATINAALARSRTVFHTPPVLGTLRDLRASLNDHIMRVEVCIDEHLQRDVQGCRVIPCQPLVELLIFDEVERLSTTALEFIRDLFDRTGVGVILIGMPGMEKRLSRYPQLYSRVGFAHHYRPLQGDALAFVLTRHWRKLGLTLDDTDFTDTQAIASLCRSNASSRSTASRSSRMMSSKPPAARWSSASPSAEESPPCISEGHSHTPGLCAQKLDTVINVHLVVGREVFG